VATVFCFVLAIRFLNRSLTVDNYLQQENAFAKFGLYSTTAEDSVAKLKLSAAIQSSLLGVVAFIISLYSVQMVLLLQSWLLCRTQSVSLSTAAKLSWGLKSMCCFERQMAGAACAHWLLYIVSEDDSEHHANGGPSGAHTHNHGDSHDHDHDDFADRSQSGVHAHAQARDNKYAQQAALGAQDDPRL